MRSAAREGARAHLLVMGVIWATHIASPIPSKSGPHSSGDAPAASMWRLRRFPLLGHPGAHVRDGELQVLAEAYAAGPLPRVRQS